MLYLPPHEVLASSSNVWKTCSTRIWHVKRQVLTCGRHALLTSEALASSQYYLLPSCWHSFCHSSTPRFNNGPWGFMSLLTKAVKSKHLPLKEWQSHTVFLKSYMSSINPLTPFCNPTKNQSPPPPTHTHDEEEAQELVVWTTLCCNSDPWSKCCSLSSLLQNSIRILWKQISAC